MKKGEFKKLLTHGSDTWLDWQDGFPVELLKGDDHPGWEAGRAKLLRDLAAMANRAEGETGYVIFGVKDQDDRREVTGIFKSWKGTNFQSWAGEVFEAPLNFSYAELAWSDTIRVGIFAVALDPGYPHVVRQGLGGILHPGQVWIRRGRENAVALREDLRRIFLEPRPGAS
jgi:predicted HTH transcriptional regulator